MSHTVFKKRSVGGLKITQRTTAYRCKQWRWMRFISQMSIEEIAAEDGVDEHTVWRHTEGQCEHGPENDFDYS